MSVINEIVYKLHINLRDHLDGPDAWGTESGISTFIKISRQLTRVTDTTTIELSFKGVERTDISFQREAVLETLRRHRPGLLFIASGVENDDVLANVETSLKVASERLVLRTQSESTEILGESLPVGHFQTFVLVKDNPGLTSVELTKDPHSLESSTASARLTTLWRFGLVSRVRGVAPSGGREYKYFPIT